jgi:hypothetical protein
MGIRISINKLFRYFQKVQFADQVEIAEDSNEAVEQLLNLYNGQPVDLDKAGLETIKRRALQLAVSPSTKPSMLLNLMRIFTWEHRKSMDEDAATVRERPTSGYAETLPYGRGSVLHKRNLNFLVPISVVPLLCHP